MLVTAIVSTTEWSLDRLITIKLVKQPEPADWGALAVGTSVAAIVAYLTIGWFLRVLESVGMWPFALYRVLLAVVLVIVFI